MQWRTPKRSGRYARRSVLAHPTVRRTPYFMRTKEVHPRRLMGLWKKKSFVSLLLNCNGKTRQFWNWPPPPIGFGSMNDGQIGAMKLSGGKESKSNRAD